MIEFSSNPGMAALQVAAHNAQNSVPRAECVRPRWGHRYRVLWYHQMGIYYRDFWSLDGARWFRSCDYCSDKFTRLMEWRGRRWEERT